MVATKNLMDSIRQRLKTEALVRVPASLDEYFALATERDLTIEYENDEIIAMSLATPTHEQLVGNFGHILNNLFLDNDDVLVYGSNIGIALPDSKKYYNADVSAVRGFPKMVGRTTTIITNPFLVVEVLSSSTMERDLSEKLITYKRIESLQQAIFISQENPWVSSYTRTNDPKTWLQTDGILLEDSIKIENFTVSLRDIYRKVVLGRAS